MIIQLPLKQTITKEQEQKSKETAELLRKREDIAFCLDYLAPQARQAGLDEVAYLIELAALAAKEKLPNKIHPNVKNL